MNKFNITITDNTFEKVKILANNEKGDDHILRIEVSGGGCSGHIYDYSMIKKSEPDDIIFSKDGATIVIDKMSCSIIQDSIIDFIEELGSSYFSIKNPHAKTQCGCGNSFSI